MKIGPYQKGFRGLVVWREAHSLTLFVYKLTASYPRSEQFGLISQMRRAASSIAAQIAEGSQMITMNHRKLYYDRAYASAAELDSFLELSLDLEYITKNIYEECLRKINHTSFLLHRLSSATKFLPTAHTAPARPATHLPSLH